LFGMTRYLWHGKLQILALRTKELWVHECSLWLWN
jgi:hypothetical protein